MDRPPKHELREAIIFERLELSLGNPLMPAAEMDRLIAQAHGISISTVRYYIRTDSLVDRRVKYTPEERVRLSNMTRKELFAYAQRNNKNFNTLYAMIHRQKHGKVYDAWNNENHIKFCLERGYIYFSRLADLKAFSFPLDAFKEARKAVRGVQNLDLVAPNYLVHKPTKKFYILTLSDQQFILTNPRRFLRDRAAHVSANWRDGSQNIHKSHFLLLDTTNRTSEMLGECLEACPSFDEALVARRSYSEAIPILLVQRGGAWDGPTIKFTKGERVPQFSPDAIATVISRGNVHTISQVNKGF